MRLSFAETQPIRIDKFLSNRPEVFSRSKLKDLFKKGQIRVNQKRVKKSYHLNPDDEIEFEPPTSRPQTYQAQKVDFELLFEDKYLAVVNKPAGVVVHPGAGNKDQTLLNGLIYHFGQKQKEVTRCGIVHRLDKSTSGVMVISKDEKTHSHLCDMFAKREVLKSYYAIVLGNLGGCGVIDSPIKRSSKNFRKMVVDFSGKKAFTRYCVKKQFDGFSFLELFPKTGRTHQIRVHLASIGNPILGDETYCGQKRAIKNVQFEKQKKMKYLFANYLRRVALHSFRIEFCHPHSQKKLSFRAELPTDIQYTLEFLEKTFSL